MSNRVVELTGQRFGRLTVIRRNEKTRSGNIKWLCRCDCGNETTVASGCLRSGSIVSCGCHIREITSKRSLIHGQTKTRLHRIWTNMKTRCNNQNAINFQDYGGRGIRVCDEWNFDFVAFRDWAIQNGYSESLTIDRIDNDGNYCPKNCRWITSFKQQSNKRSNRSIYIDGEKKTVTEWGRVYNIPPVAIWARLDRGWDPVAAVKTPSDHRRKRKSI